MDPPKRKGSIAIVVLVCLALVILICAALIQVIHAERDVVRREERRLQADWLVESGLGRASAKLAQKADYQGETWEVPAERLGGPDAATVTIKVEPVEGEKSRRRVHVRADYPSGEGFRRVRSSRLVVVAVDGESKDAKDEP